MDKITKYRKLVQDLLTEYSGNEKFDEDIETQLIFDEKRDHYLWMDVGWKGSRQRYTSFMHFDIKNEKIWLQYNMTEKDPCKELVEMGVPKEDIVLGLHAPYKRPYTDYGIG